MVFQPTFRQFPGFDFLYKISESGNYQNFRVELDLLEDAFKLTRGEVAPREPVKATWVMGRKKPADIVWANHVAPIIISDRVRKVITNHGFTGWEFYEISLFGKNGEAISGYSGLVINGRCGRINDSLCKKVSRHFPYKTSTVLKGMYFDPKTWDGSNFFMPEGDNAWRFVTKEVKLVFEREKITNVAFTPLNEVERDLL